MWPVTRTGRTVESGAPGFVRRCRTTSAEWHIMSFSTPPPCSCPCQNHGMWGPLCSSAARARYGRPVSAAPRAQRMAWPCVTAGANAWFSRYSWAIPDCFTTSATRFASAKFRASGFSDAIPLSSAVPRASVSAISSTFSMRASFRPHSHTASMAGSATISAMDRYALVWPRSSRRARAAISSARCRVGLHTPSTSASRTAWNAWRWKRALNPLPMNPTPSRLPAIPSPVSRFPSVRVADAQFGERLGRAALPLGDESVADVAQVLHAQLAREEARRCEVAETVEEGDARRVLGLRLLRPGDIVQQRGPLAVGARQERLPPAVVALVVEPGQPATHGGLEVRVVAQHEVHELGHPGVGGAP